MNKQKPIYVPSLTQHQTIIETIIQNDKTAFCIGNDQGYHLANSYKSAETVYHPIPIKNELLKNGIVSFSGEPLPYNSDLELHAQIKAHISKYVTLAPDFLSLAALYVMLTWIYDSFGEVPYLRFQGDFGTGKTRALMIVGSLCFKPLNAGGASTISPIFHLLDKYEGTLILDEADFRFSDETVEIVKILNNGNQRGFPVLRSQMNERKEFEPRAFKVFGPKIIAMRGSYQDIALESRFLTESMTRGKRAESVPKQLPNERLIEAEKLKSKLLSYRLNNRFRDCDVPSSLPALPSVPIVPKLPQLPDRSMQVILPLLTISPSNEITESIYKVALLGADSLSFERGQSFEAEVSEALIATNKAGTVLSVSEITKTLKLQSNREFDKSISHQLVARTLRNKLGLSLYKTCGVMTVCPGQGERVERLRERCES
jgi:hypothetical protein